MSLKVKRMSETVTAIGSPRRLVYQKKKEKPQGKIGKSEYNPYLKIIHQYQFVNFDKCTMII